MSDNANTVSISTMDGRVSVPAKYTRGVWSAHRPHFFASHKPSRRDLQGWAITHRDSGLRAVHVATIDDARRVIDALHSLSWNGKNAQLVAAALRALSVVPSGSMQRVTLQPMAAQPASAQ